MDNLGLMWETRNTHYRMEWLAGQNEAGGLPHSRSCCTFCRAPSSQLACSAWSARAAVLVQCGFRLTAVGRRTVGLPLSFVFLDRPLLVLFVMLFRACACFVSRSTVCFLGHVPELLRFGLRIGCCWSDPVSVFSGDVCCFLQIRMGYRPSPAVC